MHTHANTNISIWKQEVFRESRHLNVCDLWHVMLTLWQGQKSAEVILYNSTPQGSQSFTAYTISKEQYDNWEWFFRKLWYNQSNTSNTLASCLLRSRTFCASRSLKFFKKECISIDLKYSETHGNAKKSFTLLVHYVLHVAQSWAV